MHNFYTIYGLDKSLINIELNKIIDKLKIDDVVKYDMSNSNLVDVIEDASTMGLFASKKIIILDDCSFLGANKTIVDIEMLENYIEHYNPNNYCILISYTEKIDSRKKINKLLSKNGSVLELNKVDDKYLSKYISDYLKDNSYKMDDINYFKSKVGSNLANIKNELEKLMMYKIDNRVITNNDIDKVTIISIEEEIFALTDAIILHDINKSISLLDTFLNRNYDEMQIIMLLASQFRSLFQIKRLLNKNKSEGEIAKTLGMNPYRVKFSVKKLYSYTEDMLISYIKKLAKMDHDIKLGLMDKKLALELFIIENKV